MSNDDFKKYFALECPICQRSMGSHDLEDGAICYPAIIALVPVCVKCQTKHNPADTCESAASRRTMQAQELAA